MCFAIFKSCKIKQATKQFMILEAQQATYLFIRTKTLGRDPPTNKEKQNFCLIFSAETQDEGLKFQLNEMRLTLTSTNFQNAFKSRNDQRT